MAGPSVKEFDQYRKARSKINDIINKYGSIECLNSLVQEYRYNGNNSLKAASDTVRNYQRNRKK